MANHDLSGPALIERWSFVVAFITIASLTAPALAQNRRGGRPTSTSRAALELPEGFQARRLRTTDGQDRRYAVFVPADYDASKRWPLVIFLHGSGERGQDGIRQTHVGLGPFIAKHAKRCPFICVFPQARGWFRNAEAKAVLEILADVQKSFAVDSERVYLTGISMGGFGTWELAMARPDLFAALIPICGGGPAEHVQQIAHLPIWAFHGARDDRVPVKLSRDLVAALERINVKPRYTEFHNQGHACWDEAYATRGLFPWLLQQTRRRPPARFRMSLDMSATPLPTQLWWLQIDEVDPAAAAVRVQAEASADGHIRLESQHIRRASIVVGIENTPPGATLTISWNGVEVFNGPPAGGQVPLACPRDPPAMQLIPPADSADETPPPDRAAGHSGR